MATPSAQTENSNEPREEASTTTPKKSNKALIIVIVAVLLIFVVFPMIGFGIFWGTVGSKIFGVVKTAQNGKVDINVGGNNISVDGSESQKWPDTAPSTVPKFTVGKISSSVKIGDTWTISVTKLTKSDYDNYVKQLKSDGFTMNEQIIVGGIQSDGGVKGDWRVSTTLTTDETGEQSLLISIIKETPQSTNGE